MDKFDHLFNNISDGVAIYEPFEDGKDFIFVNMNVAGEKLSQVNIEDIKGLRLSKVFPMAESIGLIKALRETYKTGENRELPQQLYEDIRITVFVYNRIIKLDCNRIMAIYTDETSLLRTQQELTNRLNFLNLLLKTIPIPIYYKNSDLQYAECNSAFEDFLGMTRSEIIGKTPSEIFVKDEAENIAINDIDLMTSLNSTTIETTLTTKFGKREVLINKTSFICQNETSEGIIAAIVDVTDKVKTERMLRALLSCSQLILQKDGFESIIKFIFEVAMKFTESQAGFVGIYNVQNSTHGMILSEFGGQECNVNDVLIHEFTGLKKVIYDSHESKYINNFDNQDEYQLLPEGHINIKNVLMCPFNHEDKAIGAIVIANKIDDYTDEDLQIIKPLAEMASISLKNKMMQKQLTESENRLRQAQKMEAVGTMSGGIAHDFNNILSIILGFTEMSIDDSVRDSKICNNLKEIKIASLRAKNLVQQILSFSRRSEQKMQTIVVQYIVKESIGLMRSTIPTSVNLVFDFDPVCKNLYSNVDPTHISQIVINLCTNAVQAMNDEGTLKITICPEYINSVESNDLFEINPGTYVSIIVEDTGVGISNENLDKIFDPYFTTKDVGIGSGMGLSVIYGIVKNYKGFVRVNSVPGNTKFEILLPATLHRNTVENTEDDIHMGFGERILFVDDEIAILEMCKCSLERLNYSVTGFTDPLEALEYFHINPTNFDLVITDVAMPKLTGDKLAKHILHINPDIPIIMCTGHSRQVDEDLAKEMGLKRFVQKPITRDSFSKIIREVLDAK